MSDGAARDAVKVGVIQGTDVPIIELRETDRILCPVCGAECVQEKCKAICRSATCRHRVVYNCSEF
jgi:hypothetical protein